MTDQPNQPTTEIEPLEQIEPLPERRRSPDPFTLIAGVITLVISAYVLTGGNWLGYIDPRWLLAGGALVVGVLLLAASLRPRRP